MLDPSMKVISVGYDQSQYIEVQLNYSVNLHRKKFWWNFKEPATNSKNENKLQFDWLIDYRLFLYALLLAS